MGKIMLPWSLKGVSLEARSRAKLAAGAAGEPLGKWLSDTIRKVATTDAAKPPPIADGSMMVDPDTLAPEAPAVASATPGLPTTPAATSTGDGSSDVQLGDMPATLSDPPTSPAVAVPPIEAEPRRGAATAVSDPPTEWRTAIDDVTRRLEETERRVAATVEPLQAAVERVLARLDDVEPWRRRGWRWPKFRR